MTQTASEEYVSGREAARAAGISFHTLLKRVAAGRVRVVFPVGAPARYCLADARAAAGEHTANASTPAA